MYVLIFLMENYFFNFKYALIQCNEYTIKLTLCDSLAWGSSTILLWSLIIMDYFSIVIMYKSCGIWQCTLI